MPRPKLPTVAQERHQAGLQALARLLAQPRPWQAIVQAGHAGTLDRALMRHALDVCSLQHSTTATVKLSRTSALMTLRSLIDPLCDEWGRLSPDDHTVNETNLNQLSDRARTIAEFAEALAGDAFAWYFTAETLKGQEEERQRVAERAPLVSCGTVDRLRAIRAEVTDEKRLARELDFLISMASALAGEEPQPDEEAAPLTRDEAPVSTP